jgi:DNA-directed RNA polymerase specialized sigma24 family protein
MPHDADHAAADDSALDDDALAALTRALLQRWRGGARSACVELIALHQPWLTAQVEHWLGARLKSRVEPDDIVQKVGIKLLCFEPAAEDGALERFRGLLRTMAMHVIADHHRHHFETQMRDGGEVPLLPEDSSLEQDPALDRTVSPGGAAERRSDVALARVTFWFLAPEKRDLIALRWWYDVPFADLTARFGCEESTLRMRHLRATQDLAAMMARVRTAMQRLKAPAIELLEAQAGLAIKSGSSVDSRVLARSRIDRFAAFLDALQQVADAIGEKLIPLPDSWPRSLLTATPRPPAGPSPGSPPAPPGGAPSGEVPPRRPRGHRMPSVRMDPDPDDLDRGRPASPPVRARRRGPPAGRRRPRFPPRGAAAGR